MTIKPEDIKLKNGDGDDNKSMKDVLAAENVMVDLINVIKTTLEPILGDLSAVDIRNDLLAQIHSESIIAIGGNENPAFARIINMSNKNNVVEILISWQKKEAAPAKSKTTTNSKLIAFLKKLFRTK